MAFMDPWNAGQFGVARQGGASTYPDMGHDMLSHARRIFLWSGIAKPPTLPQPRRSLRPAGGENGGGCYGVRSTRPAGRLHSDYSTRDVNEEAIGPLKL